MDTNDSAVKDKADAPPAPVGYVFSKDGTAMRHDVESAAGPGEIFYATIPGAVQLANDFPAGAPGSGVLGYTVASALLAAEAAAAAVVKAGVTVSSASTSSLNGTYALDPATQSRLTQEALYVTTTGLQGAAKFTNGQTTKGWPDASGALHPFTTAAFTTFAEAVAGFVDALDAAVATVAAGNAWSPPAQPVSIP